MLTVIHCYNKVDYDQDYEWSQLNMAAKRSILTKESTIPPMAPYFIKPDLTSCDATRVSSLASKTTSSDPSRVAYDRRDKDAFSRSNQTSTDPFSTMTFPKDMDVKLDFETMDDMVWMGDVEEDKTTEYGKITKQYAVEVADIPYGEIDLTQDTDQLTGIKATMVDGRTQREESKKQVRLHSMKDV